MYLKIPSHVGCHAVRPGPLDPEHKRTAILRNVGNCFPSDITSYTSILESSAAPTVCIPNVEMLRTPHCTKPSKPEIAVTMLKTLVSASWKTPRIYYRDKFVNVFGEHYTKRINTACGQNVGL